MIKKLLNAKIGKENKKGFTLAELLIVVAIIGVLVAISIPIFTSQLHKSRDAADKANARALYAELNSDFIANMDDKDYKDKSASLIDNYKWNQKPTVSFNSETGYTVTWTCTEDNSHSETFTTSGSGNSTSGGTTPAGS